jgi:hypothetical protein
MRCLLSFCCSGATVSLAALMAASVLRADQAPERPARAFLEQTAGFSTEELGAFDAGRAVVKAMDTPTKGEIALIGGVHIGTTKEHALAYFEELSKYEDGEVVLQAGRFSATPAVGDVARLTLDEGDIDDLRQCRPGRCGVKLGAIGIDSLAKVDWSSAAAADQVTDLARQRFVDYAAAYLARGDEALITYDDRGKPVPLAGEWRGLLSNSPYFYQYLPDLQHYLVSFPQTTLSGVISFISWSKISFRLKPTIVLTHVVIDRDPARPGRVVIAQKQIYASHYFEGALTLTVVVDAPAPDGSPGIDVVYVARSRGDLLRGTFGGLKKGVVEQEVRSGAETSLQSIKDSLEEAVRLAKHE